MKIGRWPDLTGLTNFYIQNKLNCYLFKLSMNLYVSEMLRNTLFSHTQKQTFLWHRPFAYPLGSGKLPPQTIPSSAARFRAFGAASTPLACRPHSAPCKKLCGHPCTSEQKWPILNQKFLGKISGEAHSTLPRRWKGDTLPTLHPHGAFGASNITPSALPLFHKILNTPFSVDLGEISDNSRWKENLEQFKAARFRQQMACCAVSPCDVIYGVERNWFDRPICDLEGLQVQPPRLLGSVCLRLTICVLFC